MGNRTMRGEVAIIGVGETTYYKRGRSPDAEFKLVIEAILKASADAGIDPREIDGFASYSNDRNDSVADRGGARYRGFALLQHGVGAVAAAADRLPAPTRRRRWRLDWPTRWSSSAVWRRDSSGGSARALACRMCAATRHTRRRTD